MTADTWQGMNAEDRIKKIAKLAFDGLSAREIAQQIPGATRNGVMGYVQRSDIKLARQSRSVSTPKDRARTRKVQIERAVSAKQVQSMRPVPASPSRDTGSLTPISRSRAFEPIDGFNPVHLEHLGSKQCHWPVNGLDGLQPIFCGASADRLYCNNHERLAYAPRIRGV